MRRTILVYIYIYILPHVFVQCGADETTDEGISFSFRKWQADNVAKNMDSKEVEQFIGDKDAGKEHVKKNTVMGLEMRPRRTLRHMFGYAHLLDYLGNSVPAHGALLWCCPCLLRSVIRYI
jgi:hypothetical protein